MKIDNRIYNRDLIILPDRIIDNWWRKNGHVLEIDDLKDVLDASPEILVIGTGAFGRMKVPANVLKSIESLGINVVTSKTSGAVALFNELRQKQPTAGAFHLTC